MPVRGNYTVSSGSERYHAQMSRAGVWNRMLGLSFSLSWLYLRGRLGPIRIDLDRHRKAATGSPADANGLHVQGTVTWKNISE